MDETRTNDGLKYIGDGSALLDVPARDLSADEVTRFGRLVLLSSGLYREYETKKAYTPKPRKSAWKGANADNKESE